MLEQNTSTITYEDPNPQPSELLQLLSNLKNLTESCQLAARKPSRQHLLEAIALEAELLCTKLSAMHTRWKTFLPFHESIDVNFCHWAAEVEVWMNQLSTADRPLTMGFVLDVMHEPAYTLGDELECEIPAYLSAIDNRLSQSAEGWEAKAFPEGVELCDAVAGSCQMAHQALSALKHELEELESFFSSELKQKQFRTLAYRLRARDCSKAEKDALSEVRKEHNAWPEPYVKERAKKLKDDVKLSILREPMFAEVSDYLDLDYPEPYQDACFGQFLFKNRHNFSKAQVQELTKNLEKIRLLNEYIDPRGTQRKRAKVAHGRLLSEEEKILVNRLCAMIGSVQWRNGSTADSVTLGLKKMLGVEFSLDNDSKELSDRLWQLLTNRPKCDAEKSFRVTWLNMVGWCVSKGLLSEKSPTLCKTFFPNCGLDDYKAIDKGRNNPPKIFKAIIPLLERFLK